MAITIVSQPKDWGRVWDSNRLNYKFSSNNWQQPNMNFYFVAKRYDIVTALWVELGTFFLYPLNGGTVNFNPSIIYRNYLTNDIDATLNTGEEAINSATNFGLDVYEYYSDTTNNGIPFKHTAGSGTTTIKLFNGAQGMVAYDDISVGPGNAQWVMSGASSGIFLTDAVQFRMDNTDRGYLYYLADPLQKPTRIRFTMWYWWPGGALPDVSNYGVNPSTQLDFQSMPNQTYATLTQGAGTDGSVTPDSDAAGFRSGVTYLDLTYSYAGSLMHYFPMGPENLSAMSLLGNASLATWLYYKIDVMSGSTVLTKSPFWVIRQDKCNKYPLWQMFWLNPHGGFDTYTFNKKTLQTSKIDRTTYKQRLLPTQTNSSFQAGERVFNTNAIDEITLQSDSITQQESQILVQMAKSPIVYALKRYGTTPYLVPYIITSNEVPYEQKINNKLITFEVTIRPANQNIIQQN